MEPLNPINPPLPGTRIRRPERKVDRREPGTGGDLQKQDNASRKRRKPDPGEHQVDELA